MTFRLILMFAALGLCALPAAAKPVESTRYKYYSISGDTAREIYNAMLRRGPDVNGVNAYASTLANSQQTGTMIQSKTCRVEDYKLKMDFTINLPRLKNEKALTGATRDRWNQFEAFLRKHEETHKSIWMGCARALEQQVRAVRFADCKKVDKEAKRLWDRMRASCQKKHDAFDNAERARLLKHPFVKLVFGGRPLTIKTQ